MGDPFIHLRVASGYSLRHGASHPSRLVARAADHGMDTLALTDRDGLYGAIRFAKACVQSGLSPVIGADWALAPDTAPAGVGPTPAKGGRLRDLRHPRVVTLAQSRQGWAQLCRLTTAVHLSGARGEPLLDQARLVEHAGALVVLLGADSPYGLACAQRREEDATRQLHQWCHLVGRENVAVAVSHREVPGSGSGSLVCAARMAALADRHSVTVVLVNDVRMADAADARTVDILDAARRLVPLDARNVDRRNAEGHLKSGKQMLGLAQQVAQAAGRGERGAERLLGDTRALGVRCRLDPRTDLGLGGIHLPEFGVDAAEAMGVLRQRCHAGMAHRYPHPTREVRQRLEDELAIIEQLGYPAYFLTVADVTAMIRERGIRCAARGSGAGSLVNHLLGISGVDPMAHGLLMERFLSPLRRALPDIDLDVESARRTEVYRAILERFGGERVACIAMLDTYRVRHAVRDVGAALSMPPLDIDAIATAFPHIRARNARAALQDLPELRAAGLAEQRLDLFFSLVESLDGLPRHVSIHPCGVVLSDATMLDRTPVEASAEGFPMCQFDKDDVEDIGLLKLDVLGIRMQSAMATAVESIAVTTGEQVDIDSLAPFDDPQVYDMIAHTHTLGCFQIESPGQRELVGKFGPRTFADIIIDISLFRPGPVKSNMVVPFLNARNGWTPPHLIHPSLAPALAQTEGVLVFHEQVIQVISLMTGCTLAQGDEARRALGDEVGRLDVSQWFRAKASQHGYTPDVIDTVWDVLAAFASFGFCKAHAAAFALPTYQSAWLKRHHPAHFLAGVMTHDPGMYPKRLMVEEARQCGITLLGLDINHSRQQPVVEEHPAGLDQPAPGDGRPDGRGWAIRLGFDDVAGMHEQERTRVVAGQPWASLTDVWQRAHLSLASMEKLVLCGAFDGVYGVGKPTGVTRHGHPTRRDLLLTINDLARDARLDSRASRRARGLRPTLRPTAAGADPRDRARSQVKADAQANTAGDAPAAVAVQPALQFGTGGHGDVVVADVVVSGLPEMSAAERRAAELQILGLDASSHVMTPYIGMLRELGATPSRLLRSRRTGTTVWCAGAKVATQTPPIRSGRRVVFLTLDDSTGPVDATFFEDAQGPYARTVFSSWLLLVRGTIRRTGNKGLSLNATGAWDLEHLHQQWQAALRTTGSTSGAAAHVWDILHASPPPAPVQPATRAAKAESGPVADAQQHAPAGGMGQRRVLVHANGFVDSPYTDITPAGNSQGTPPRKLWHASPGSSGR